MTNQSLHLDDDLATLDKRKHVTLYSRTAQLVSLCDPDNAHIDTCSARTIRYHNAITGIGEWEHDDYDCEHCNAKLSQQPRDYS